MAPHAESHAHDPLIWATTQAIFAIDPDSGALRWRAKIPVLRRLFRLGERLFVLTVEGVKCFEVSTGKAREGVELGFVPTTGIATSEHLFVAGPEGAAALTPGGMVLWSVTPEQAHGTSQRRFFACQGTDGFALWREEIGEEVGEGPGLVFGDQVAQPGLDSA